MWHAEHILQTTTEPEAIWARWMDVPSWPEWDGGLDEARCSGPVASGSLLTLNLHPSGVQTMQVIEVQDGRGFTCRRKGFLVEERIQRSCEPSPLGCRVIQRVEVRGPMAWWLHLISARRLRENLPKVLRRLAHIASKMASA